MKERNSSKRYSFKSFPSSSIFPSLGSYNREIRSKKVDFPDPIFPMTPTVVPLEISRLILFKA